MEAYQWNMGKEQGFIDKGPVVGKALIIACLEIMRDTEADLLRFIEAFTNGDILAAQRIQDRAQARVEFVSLMLASKPEATSPNTP